MRTGNFISNEFPQCVATHSFHVPFRLPHMCSKRAIRACQIFFTGWAPMHKGLHKLACMPTAERCIPLSAQQRGQQRCGSNQLLKRIYLFLPFSHIGTQLYASTVPQQAHVSTSFHDLQAFAVTTMWANEGTTSVLGVNNKGCCLSSSHKGNTTIQQHVLDGFPLLQGPQIRSHDLGDVINCLLRNGHVSPATHSHRLSGLYFEPVYCNAVRACTCSFS